MEKYIDEQMKNLFVFFFFFLVVVFFFWKTVAHGLLPIPSDTIIGLYHPYRDLYALEYPNGIPYKNFLITDPVRQQYPWRKLAIDELKAGNVPLWNPYAFSGYPLLANLQSAAFYPLNFVFFLFPFRVSWTVLIILQPLLSAIGMYLFLRKRGLLREAGILGSISYAFSGFSIAWLEWNTIGHILIWLPVVLYLTDFLIDELTQKVLRKKPLVLLFILLIFAESSYWFAGHLQVAFYVWAVTTVYLIWRILCEMKKRSIAFRKLFTRSCIYFSAVTISVVILTFPQWYSLFQFISHSSRSLDQANWQAPGWFIPLQHLVQFVSPDFFGNPATLNYWGVWNYAEFIGYIGIVPLMFAILSIFAVKNGFVRLLTGLLVIALLFATDNPIARLPFQLQIPLLSTTQPTRLLVIVDFALAVLAAYGFDAYIRRKLSNRSVFLTIGVVAGIYGLLWGIVQFLIKNNENMLVAKRNLVLPTSVFVVFVILFLLRFLLGRLTLSGIKMRITLPGLFIVLTIIDLFRFGWKFTPFTPPEYLFPQTLMISYLQQQKGPFRIMTTDSRILPPNFSLMYGIQSVEGYDPLYLSSYADVARVWTGTKTGDFNRMITPHNPYHPIANLLNVRYILSFDDLASPRYTLVFQEGQTKLYENHDAFPRAFFVEEIRKVTRESMQETLTDESVNLRNTAFVADEVDVPAGVLSKDETVTIAHYSSNSVDLSAHANQPRMLIVSDAYYPNWRVTIDGSPAKIYLVDYALRGVVVPEGTHTIQFTSHLL
ncbi:YfhO family protein [Candidatus Roizmanbacteria bacterium]|nr:YfhO family protein [Candidatus Roizmanbacteria bacterium]